MSFSQKDKTLRSFSKAWQSLPQNLMNKAIDQWHNRSTCYVGKEGGHFEYMFK